MSLSYESEYNDDLIYANRFDGKISGSLGSYSDVDWFVFSNPYPTSLSVVLTVPENGLWNFQFHDEKLQVLSGRNIDSTLIFQMPAYSVGDYAIRVQTTFPQGVLYNGGQYEINIENATYSVKAIMDTYEEGDFALFEVTRFGFDNDYSIYYKLSGPGADDFNGVVGAIPKFVNNKSIISIPLTGDGLIEGEELLVLSLGMYTGGVGDFVSNYVPISDATASVTVVDSSRENIKTEDVYSLSVVVDRNVLAADAVLLKGLTEKILYQDGIIVSHTVIYDGAIFDYSAIDSLIMAVVRDGEFTEEFSREVAEYAPDAAGITYQEAVELIGVESIDAAILAVAGADGLAVV